MKNLLTFILLTISLSSLGQASGNDKWNFKKYLSDSATSKLAKDIFNDNDWNLQNEVLAFLDSLSAKDKLARPFYFKVVTKSYKKADGAYAEGLGNAGKNYVENNTKEFLNYFTDKKTFTKKELDDWAGIVMLEISLVAENADKDVFNKMIKNLNSNCKDCTAEQQKILNYFIEQLNLQWKELAKSSNK